MNSEAILLDGSDLALSETEAKIAASLASATDVDANVYRACEQLEVVLANVLRLLAGNRQSRYWQLDDLSCTSFGRAGDVVTLQGIPNWLRGGEGCDRFCIDVALDTSPLLYSYKFTRSVTDEQLLYVGKTPTGWLVHGP